MHQVMHRLDDARLYSQQKPLHSESFLKNVVESHQLTATDTDLIFERVRGNGFLHRVPDLDLHRKGGLAGWKPGKWMHRNRHCDVAAQRRTARICQTCEHREKSKKAGTHLVFLAV